MTVEILLVDDHPIVLDGLRAALERQPDLDVVGETGDGLAAIPLFERLKPDVVVLDLMLPGLGGLEITRQIRKQTRRSCVVILSMHANEAYVAAVFRAGALGYVLKKSASREIVRAIRTVLRGERYLSPSLSEEALVDYEEATEGTEDEELDLYKTLTPREREVLHLVAGGLTNQEAAARLEISRRTVEMHRANLMRKLNLRTTADLVRYAVQRGIHPPE